MSETSTVYTQRLATAQRLMQEADLHALVITAGSQLQLLTGLGMHTHERFSALIVTANAVTVLAPAVDQQQVFAGVEQVSWQDGENPYALAASFIPGGRVALAPEMDAIHVLALRDALAEKFGAANVELSISTAVLKEIFMRKDAAAIAEIAAVAAAIDRVHAAVPAMLQAGRTEREIADEISALILQEHESIDFVIVGSGSNGANPHHSFSDRVLQPGDFVVVDLGGTNAAGYHSDCTRTYQVPGATTAGDDDLQQMYAVLQRAQEAAVNAVRPGVTAASIDAVARGIITDAGFGEFFVHRTGHGLGLSLHEEPFIMAGNDLVLEPGMVFSVEPGIYLPDRQGARIEDIVVVTDDGVRRLNNQPRTLDGQAHTDV